MYHAENVGELRVSRVARVTRWISMFPPTLVDGVSSPVTIGALFVGRSFVRLRTRATTRFHGGRRTTSYVDKQVGIICDGGGNLELSFVLNHHGENTVDR